MTGKAKRRDQPVPSAGCRYTCLDVAQPKAAGPPARDDREATESRPSPANVPAPDPFGLSSDPESRPSPRVSTRSAGAYVVAALVLIVALDAWLTSERGVPTTPASQDTTLDDVLAASISQLDLAAPPAGVGPIEDLPGWNSCSSRCRREMTVGGVPLSFRVPTRSWEAFGDVSINKSVVGPQGAEAIIYWTTIPGDYANPCTDVFGWPVPSSSRPFGAGIGARTMRELVAEVAKAPGTELLAGPSNVIVSGRRAQRVGLLVHQDLGCDPGYFIIWHDMEAGAIWPATEAGHTIRAWIVDVAHTPIFIVAVSSEEATEQLHREIGLIVRSIRLDPSTRERPT